MNVMLIPIKLTGVISVMSIKVEEIIFNILKLLLNSAKLPLMSLTNE